VEHSKWIQVTYHDGSHNLFWITDTQIEQEGKFLHLTLGQTGDNEDPRNIYIPLANIKWFGDPTIGS
jgi:hypothetical protein